MNPTRRPRVTIGRLMALIAAFAVVLTLPHLQTLTEFKVAACAFALLPILILANYVVEALFGIRCPGCGRWTLRRLVSCSSYFSCSGCGMRYKRFGLGPWLDATGPEDDAMYSGKTRARTWMGFSVPEDPGDTTSGALLRNKRLRGRIGERTNSGRSE
jgi:hypothetical protein